MLENKQTQDQRATSGALRKLGKFGRRFQNLNLIDGSFYRQTHLHTSGHKMQRLFLY